MLFPIIVPRRYNAGGRWIGPMRNLRHPELAITWVRLVDPGSMSYLSHAEAKELEASGTDFHAEAMENLRASSIGDQLVTHQKVVGDRLVFAVAMHDDGLGTSRLLLLPEWAERFPQGFELGIPERSCGIIVPAGIAASERESAIEVIAGCFEDGNTPMLPGLHAADQFSLEQG